MLFGNKIRELRDEQCLSQRQLAAALEIDTPMFSKIERGDIYEESRTGSSEPLYLTTKQNIQ